MHNCQSGHGGSNAFMYIESSGNSGGLAIASICRTLSVGDGAVPLFGVAPELFRSSRSTVYYTAQYA